MRISKADLEKRVEQLSSDNCVLSIALNCVMEKECHHVGTKRGYSVYLCQPTAAHGGIVLVRFNPGGQKAYTSAHYFEAWFSHWEHYPFSSDAQDQEALACRELAYEARRMINAANTVQMEEAI